MTTYVKSYGMIQNDIKNNNTTTTSGAKWIGDYDGTLANVDIDINHNGSVEHAHLQLDNDDLLDILNMETINKPIDQRLQTDFLLDTPFPHMPAPPMPIGLKYPCKIKRHKLQKYTKRRGVKKSKKNKHKNKSRKIDSLIQLSSL